MVANVTSLTGNGLKDWLIQRLSAIYLAGYFIYLMSYILSHTPMNAVLWHRFFAQTSVKIATIMALFFFILHAWIGLWTVMTDYVKCHAIRLTLQGGLFVFLFGQFVWACMILWGYV